ncbi:Sodium/calcium exchanger protein-domain-containing protein [Annulohypoxylon truncatum]|uniref:Sodium/calcium exchanger protein-domain-containing protein n=1 Tax=Annulohypoxylon truncatum TaxID=327061 RepID=UPI002008B83D|nr:Sodium/calcium exchanger protein-domain-containing protein [Annulohypoxylon truncatum]KAI1208336.1 Sodium/calcium exchanger protein-domain-containing protein [Annulohypoxylon truncatum]
MAARRSSSGHRDREKAPRRSRNGEREPALPKTRQEIVNGPSEKKKGLFRVKSAGESGRSGIHPLKFLAITWRSSNWVSRMVNILWPFVPAAIALHWAIEDHAVLKFSLAYVAMVPCANLIGFAGQELARKLPHMFGVLTEITIASIVEIILFMILLFHDEYYVIQAAILGSILANMLLCLGLCFFAAGLRREESTFHAAVSEVGSNLLLIAGLGLAIPTVFERSVTNSGFNLTTEEISTRVLHISRIIAVLLIIAYAVFIFFQMHTHHGIYDELYELDEARDADGHKDRAKEKYTFTECILALAVAVALVTLIAIALVGEIPAIVENHNISDPFMGLILVPLVEKAAEHLTAIDEAWDNQINFALSHCIGATIQTAMLNAPLVAIVGWIAKRQMALEFEIFDIVMLILAIITVGNVLRDQKSDYLEGFLCVVVYVAIAVAAFYFPNPHEAAGTETTGETTEVTVHAMRHFGIIQ